jgi:hypothetical protein
VNRDTLISLVSQEVKGLSSYLDEHDYVNALSDACRETGWSLPASTDFQIFWLKSRVKRHLFSYLQTEQAYKFKFEQINLQQRFEHLDLLIKRMDREFEVALRENLALFTGVGLERVFGSYIHPGFATDDIGRETTYLSDNEVVVTPNDTD